MGWGRKGGWYLGRVEVRETVVGMREESTFSKNLKNKKPNFFLNIVKKGNPLIIMSIL